jgi:hypothetical protein
MFEQLHDGVHGRGNTKWFTLPGGAGLSYADLALCKPGKQANTQVLDAYSQLLQMCAEVTGADCAVTDDR